MLLTMKSVCQITCCFEKRPEPSQETSGTMFFKARSKFFFGISNFFLFTISELFLPKILKHGHLEGKAYGESKKLGLFLT